MITFITKISQKLAHISNEQYMDVRHFNIFLSFEIPDLLVAHCVEAIAILAWAICRDKSSRDIILTTNTNQRLSSQLSRIIPTPSFRHSRSHLSSQSDACTTALVPFRFFVIGDVAQADVSTYSLCTSSRVIHILA